ncbi:STAS domain-containing protein [Streptomyces virginiae]|uniref:STAS domain-containing protein n=1 Tax=Streptomyces virginiae TaxID=1961 RepID=UPI0036A14202
MAGKLDTHTAPDVRQALGAAAAVYEETVVDLARLTFCDSTGLRALITVRNTARHQGTDLRWQHIPSHLQRLLRASRTHLTGTSLRPSRIGPAPLPKAATAGRRPPAPARSGTAPTLQAASADRCDGQGGLPLVGIDEGAATVTGRPVTGAEDFGADVPVSRAVAVDGVLEVHHHRPAVEAGGRGVAEEALRRLPRVSRTVRTVPSLSTTSVCSILSRERPNTSKKSARYGSWRLLSRTGETNRKQRRRPNPWAEFRLRRLSMVRVRIAGHTLDATSHVSAVRPGSTEGVSGCR